DRAASGRELMRLVTDLQDWRALTKRLQARGFPEALVRALRAGRLTEPGALKDEARLTQACETLRKTVDSCDVLPDEEHGGFVLEVARDVNGARKAGRVDAEFLSGYEMKRAGELALSLD